MRPTPPIVVTPPDRPAPSTPTGDRSTRRKWRMPAILGASVAVHALALTAAFMLQAKEPPPGPRTEVVRVLAGSVDPTTGSFEAAGLYDARVRITPARP